MKSPKTFIPLLGTIAMMMICAQASGASVPDIGALKAAAEKGDASAANRLGYLYDKGEGVKKDEVAARVWFEKAAATGLAKAQYNLARFWIGGLGGPADVAKGVEMLGSAARQGLVPAQLALGQTYYFGANGQKKDYRVAFEYFLAAGNGGDAEAQNYLGTMHRFGQGTKVNREQAVAWWQKAANQGHAKAQASLADALLTGTGVNRDKIAAVGLYMLSAEQGEVTGEHPLNALMPGLDPATLKGATKWADDFRALHKPAAAAKN